MKQPQVPRLKGHKMIEKGDTMVFVYLAAVFQINILRKEVRSWN